MILDGPEKRSRGLYWVTLVDSVTIQPAHWDGTRWYLIGHGRSFGEVDIQEVNARLRPPAEVRQQTTTRRECQVLRLIAEGKTVKEIAQELDLSVKTVDCHKSNLMRKLGLHKTAQCVLYAVKAGLVDVKAAREVRPEHDQLTAPPKI